MAFIECGNGHIFDTDQYQTCPYCQGGIRRVEFGTVNNSQVGKTVPGGYMEQTPYQTNNSAIGETVAPQGYQDAVANAKQTEASEDIGKTVAVFKKKMNMEPVVGWLVCIEGADKGKSYIIYAKINSIGRSEKMDICINGDTTISRENHAKIGYDEKHNAFHLIPGENVNSIYIDDEPVYVPVKMEAYQLIEFGETKLVFVPFCNDKFTWKDGLK